MQVFMSAYRPEYTLEENQQAMEALESTLRFHSLAFAEVIGVYNGEIEASVRVLCGSYAIPWLHEVSKAFEQECILIADDDGSYAHLLYPDGHTTGLGTLCRVSETEARQHTSYTEAHDGFWVCK